MSPHKTVITGAGLVTPVGVGLERAWSALLDGKSGAGAITLFDAGDLPCRIACQVPDFDAAAHMEGRLARTLDRYAQFAIAAALQAVEGAGLVVAEEEAHRVGVYVGSGMGGIMTIEATRDRMLEKGARRGVSPYFIPAILPNLAAGHIAILLGARGPNLAHVSACASGAHAIGEAAGLIRRGEADVMVAGGSEAAVCALGLAGFSAMRALSRRNHEPERASRPFDAERDGFVMGEGAGVLVLESEARARDRGAKILAELAGYAANADAHHITQPAPDAAGARRCMAAALQDAGAAPEQVAHINAHGTSTPYNDAAETAAIKALFGQHARRLTVSGTKSMTGHLLGAAGGVEAAIAALTVSRGVIPPTINLENPDPACDLDYVCEGAREAEVGVAMSNSFGFGGTNACLVLRRWRR